jgi:hypothetical protein
MRRNGALRCTGMAGKGCKAALHIRLGTLRIFTFHNMSETTLRFNWEHKPIYRLRIRRREKLFTHYSDQDCAELYLHAPWHDNKTQRCLYLLMPFVVTLMLLEKLDLWYHFRASFRILLNLVHSVKLNMLWIIITSNPCGGGVEYLHRESASRKRRRNGTKKRPRHSLSG